MSSNDIQGTKLLQFWDRLVARKMEEQIFKIFTYLTIHNGYIFKENAIKEWEIKKSFLQIVCFKYFLKNC